MMLPIITLLLITLTFTLAGGAVFYLKKTAYIRLIPVVASLLVSLFTCGWIIELYHHGVFAFCFNNMLIDKLAIFHIILVNVIFTATAIYSIDYFEPVDEADPKAMLQFRRYNGLWLAFYAMLLLVLISNNIGLIWIALESTTIVSSFLILSEKNGLSIEAMWKYLLVCSVGIALAFIGTILVIAAAHALPSHDMVYTFSELHKYSTQLDPSLMLFAFIFIVVGFGTKAGLAPMHTWLPDAHSQAPTPISTLFSGVMLNCALFVIMRYLPIIDCTGEGGYAHAILIFFGFTSIIVAAVFIPIQYDLKRLLAYCSVEHLGIITLCLGIGGFGAVVALLHTINHSLAKMLAFFSAGSIIKQYKTRDMTKLSGVIKLMPFWGTLFLLAMFSLLGIAPSAVFFSELLLVKTCFSNADYLIMGGFIFFALVIFVAMFKFTLDIVYGSPNPELKHSVKSPSLWLWPVLGGTIAEFIIFGLWLPLPLMQFLQQAADIIEHGIKL